MVQNGFQSGFLGPYGIPHANKWQAKKFLHFSFLATAIVWQSMTAAGQLVAGGVSRMRDFYIVMSKNEKWRNFLA